jgi:hypothetical protein
MPTSLAFHDMGLSTFISNSNMDANGIRINSDQASKVKRMRHLNRISSSNRSHDRNLKNAFAILNGIKDKLSIPLMLQLLLEPQKQSLYSFELITVGISIIKVLCFTLVRSYP